MTRDPLPVKFLAEQWRTIYDLFAEAVPPHATGLRYFERLLRLEQVVKDVLALKADDVCWRDVYTEMAALVGVEFNPELLPKAEFLHNCEHFHDCLKSGEPYVTPARVA